MHATKNTSEKSAIDFVLATEQIEEGIQRIIIDEKCDYVLKGSSLTDHNSIIMDLDVGEAAHAKNERVTRWRLNAPTEKWDLFENELLKKADECRAIMEQEGNDINYRYGLWKALIETQALQSIGKTTSKLNRGKKESSIIKTLRKQKREAKKKFEKETDCMKKPILRDEYIQKQIELREQIHYEHEEQMESCFTRMVEKGIKGFWEAMKNTQRDELSNWICMKDENGKQILDHEQQKETAASYYENLYSPDDELQAHPYHDYVKTKMIEYTNDLDHEQEWYNELPCKKSVENAILLKKNNKATTDLPNEILKGGGKGLVECIYPVFKRFWNNGELAKELNEGVITSVYKGKGDREKLNFQRGITVSSSISMIFEELINQRITKMVPLTPAQG